MGLSFSLLFLFFKISFQERKAVLHQSKPAFFKKTFFTEYVADMCFPFVTTPRVSFYLVKECCCCRKKVHCAKTLVFFVHYTVMLYYCRLSTVDAEERCCVCPPDGGLH